MHHSLHLSILLIGSAATITVIQSTTLALTVNEIAQVAQSVTVRIETPGTAGSGVIIQRDGSLYTVLTARHVMSNMGHNEEAYVIPASNESQSYRIDNSSVQFLPDNIDLAVFRFQSNKIYQTARLGNSDVISPGEEVYVSGYPLVTAALNRPLLQFTRGDITANTNLLLDSGYALVYTNQTLPGMSGGAVFNRQGEVVGIHGRADKEETQATDDPNIVVKTGFNLAVPINTFQRWNSLHRFVAVNSSPSLRTPRSPRQNTQPQPSRGFSNQQIAEKLDLIPVYTMGILDGNKVTFLQESITPEGGEEVRISRVYLNIADAQNDLNELKASNSELPANVSIATVSLREVYCISQQNQADRCEGQPASPEEPPAFIYFPDREQLSEAVTMLQAQGVNLGENPPLFVPLFLAQFQRPGEEPRTVPAIYFSIDNLQADLEAARQQQPELANTDINVQVTTLDRVIQQLKVQNHPDLSLVQFVPLRFNRTAPN